MLPFCLVLHPPGTWAASPGWGFLFFFFVLNKLDGGYLIHKYLPAPNACTPTSGKNEQASKSSSKGYQPCHCPENKTTASKASFK